MRFGGKRLTTALNTPNRKEPGRAIADLCKRAARFLSPCCHKARQEFTLATSSNSLGLSPQLYIRVQKRMLNVYSVFSSRLVHPLLLPSKQISLLVFPCSLPLTPYPTLRDFILGTREGVCVYPNSVPSFPSSSAEHVLRFLIKLAYTNPAPTPQFPKLPRKCLGLTS